MALQVPQQHVPQIKKMLDLTDEELKLLSQGLSTAAPSFNFFDLASDIADRVKNLPRGLVEGAMLVLASLYITRYNQALWSTKTVENFVDQEVGPAWKTASGMPPGQEWDAKWARLSKFLVGALSMDKTLGTASKAGHVLTEHERLFHEARIMTDIRPIFHQDVSEEPDAAMLVHMLRITERDRLGNQKMRYFALDSNDVRLMKALFERAIKKEETLKKTMKGSKINVLTPKMVF